MNEECLICKAPLEYLDTDEIMECELCHKKQNSKTKCIKGHFVCDDCHTKGMDKIISICLLVTFLKYEVTLFMSLSSFQLIYSYVPSGKK